MASARAPSQLPLPLSHRPPRRPPPPPPSIPDAMRHPDLDPPLPRPTTPPPLPRRLQRRQDTQPTDCGEVGNDVYSCSPTQGQRFFQGQSMKFVWNVDNPFFTGNNHSVDVYLYHDDTLLPATSRLGLDNSAGRTAFNINDTWFGADGLNFNGTQRPFAYFFKIVPSGQNPVAAVPQATFSAIQTRALDSVISSSIAAASSSSVAAASSSAAAASSSASLTSSGSQSTGTASSSSSTGGPNSTGGVGGGSIQNNSNGSSFPGWAIAVIVILGVLAILAFLLVSFFVIQRLRRRKQERQRPTSMGSSTPIMAETRGISDPNSPVHDAAAAQPLLGLDRARSNAGSTNTRDPDAPFSGADAEIMAAAFRETLRKPDFASRPIEEGESPEVEDNEDKLERELAEEGRDLRSVSASRVRVHGDESEAGTIRDERERPSYDSPSVDSG